MKYAPRKVYIKESGGYVELSYTDFCRRRQADKGYMDKLFIPVQGCLLEVVREQYADFYRDRERWRYLLREEMHRDGLNVYDYYYITDHHWNMRGGFYAFKKIVNWISEKTNYPYDNVTTDINNYEIKLYPQWHMGSRAQRTGEKFAGKADDYELFVPKFTTRILNNKDKTVKPFYESLVNDSIFKTRPKKTNRYTYDSAYDKNDINDLESLDSKTPLTILFLGDSYSRGVKPFMLLTYKHFYFVWGNYNINELIKKYSPDVVIVETYPENLQYENIYKF